MKEYDDQFINDHYIEVRETRDGYDPENDFTSLKAWQKAKEVKLFFYKIFYQNFQRKKNILWITKLGKLQLVQQQILQKVMEGTTIRKEYNFIGFQDLLFMS